MLAPTSSSLAEVVVAVPLLLVALLPTAAAVTSRGLVGLRPLYSRMRTSGKSGGRAKAHGDGIAVRGRAGDVLGVVDGLAEAAAAGRPGLHRRSYGEGVGVATGIGDGADGGGGVVPADDDNVQVTGGLGGGVGDGDRSR